MAFRMDDRKQRIIVEADGGQGIGVFGWEVADAPLDELAARLEAAAGVGASARGALALTSGWSGPDRAERSARQSPEIFHGAETTSDRFVPGRSISAFAPGRSASAMSCSTWRASERSTV